MSQATPPNPLEEAEIALKNAQAKKTEAEQLLKNVEALRKHNEGDYDAAARAFGLWNKAKNPATGQLQVLRGLTARRAAESALYLKMPDNNSRSALATWTWPTMLRCPGISEKRTPVPWRRLQDVGLVGIDAIDLLPPGGDVNEAEAVLQARYVQGCLSALDSVGLGYDLVVLLGGKVSNAFKAADIRLNEMRLLEYRLGCITLPSPHVVETDAEGWWSNDAKMARMRSVISKIVQRRCILCINGDTVEDGCVKCSQHSRGCVVGGFCAICRKGG
jgi:hypothetical protein